MPRDPRTPLKMGMRFAAAKFLAAPRIAVQRAFRAWITSAFVLIAVSGCDHGASQQTSDRPTNTSERVADNGPSQERQPPAGAVPDDPKGRKPILPENECPRQVYRPDDLRRPHDDERLLEAGIQVFESKRLKLYTDIEGNFARSLPGLIDQLYVDWEAYLGPLPPNRAGTDFQMTGYLMRDMALFRELGLMPEDVSIDHGRHQRNEFWMRDQSLDYYRRHLLIHEATHCFMTFMPDVNAPVWYLEGMAEYFGTHRIDSDEMATFRVMPTSLAEFAGFGRIEKIREDIVANKSRTISSIIAFPPNEFVTISHYAWSWSLCAFLDGTPRYHERFQELSRNTQGTQFSKVFEQSFGEDQRDLATEWTLFTHNLQYGYDFTRSAIEFQPGELLTAEHPEKTVDVDAGRGWQSSRVRLEQGRTYRVTATGRFSLCDQPKPWLSEPQGITFCYFEGNPIGTLLGCLRTEAGPAGGDNDPMLHAFVLGSDRTIKPSVTGTLYLRLNDGWNSLHDNRGRASVIVRESSGPAVAE